jgi:hypothetical protein
MPKVTARDAFRFSRAALGIQTKTTAQKLVLLTLAIRTSGKTGTCHPSYESLCHDTGLGRATIASTLRYLRDELHILSWKRGHSNQYTKPLANLYTLDYERMAKLSEESAEFTSQVAEFSSASAEFTSRSAEFTSARAEFTGGTPTTKLQLQSYNYKVVNYKVRQLPMGMPPHL